MFLPTETIVRLTGRKRFTAQRKVLDGLGIRYIVSGKGEPLVREEALDGKAPARRNRGPNWDRLNA